MDVGLQVYGLGRCSDVGLRNCIVLYSGQLQ